MAYEDQHYVQTPGGIKKGAELDLMNKDPTVRELLIAAGWDMRSLEGEPLDVDVSCFVLGRDGLTRNDEDFIFYNNQRGCGGAVRHTGDSRTGAGDGDDETLIVDLNGVPFDVMQIVFVISIYEGDMRNQDFSGVRNVFLRVANNITGDELVRYEMDADLEATPEGTAITVGALCREGPHWLFRSVGDVSIGGLGPIASKYGIIVG